MDLPAADICQVTRVPRWAPVALGLAVLAVAGYAVAPVSRKVAEGGYVVIAALAVTVGLLTLWHRKPRRRAGWTLVLGGYAGWVVGDAIATVEGHLLPGRYPVPSDVVYLSSYAAVGAGILLLVRSRREGDLPALLDSCIVATGAGIVIAALVIGPLSSDSDLSAFGTVVAAAYPVADAFLLGVLGRMWAAPGARTASYRWLASSLALTAVADLVWNVASQLDEASGIGRVLTSTGAEQAVNTAWLLSYVGAAAAVVAPSMSAVAEPSPARETATPEHRRLVALGGGLMLPSLALLVDGADGGRVQWPTIGVGALLLAVLVLVRVAGLLRTVEVQAVRLAALARSDALTGAPNRRTWDHELSRACLDSRDTGLPLAVAILDLDHFKLYNDTRGHQAGDRLLRESVAAWSDLLGDGRLLARYGGEEFALLMPQTSLHRAVQTVNVLREATPDGQTFSAGVAVWDPATEPSVVVAWADEALYRAKRAGRNRILAHSPLPPAEAARALPAFTVVTQPIVALGTGDVVAHEARARYEPGAQEAAGVVERAHQQGFGDLLEAAVVRAALEQLDRPTGHALHVNVTTAALGSRRFWDAVPRRLDGVVVELRDGVEATSTPVVREYVELLRSAGARVALDDIGAGAHQLAWLVGLEPDVVKVDADLVRGCHRDRHRAAVIRALTAYGRHAEVTVCAQGVEAELDLYTLVRLEVTHAQGDLFGAPGPGWRTAHGVSVPSAVRPAVIR